MHIVNLRGQRFNLANQLGWHGTAVMHGLRERGHLARQLFELAGGQRDVFLDRVDPVIHIAHAVLDGLHRWRNGIGRIHAVAGDPILADDLALHLLGLQLGQLADRSRHVIKPLVDGRKIDFGRLLDHRAQGSDLRFEPLDLPGFPDSARQQLDHMGELLDLAGHFAHAAVVGALRLELVFQTTQAAR